jgi:hypothetical protein
MLSKNYGETWQQVAGDIIGTSYDWKVPIPWKDKRNCLLKVTGHDALGMKVGEDTSDFTIEVVKVTSPNGGENLTSGSLHTITWKTNSTKRPVRKVELLYTKNQGRTWRNITTLNGNPGTYEWKIPGVITTKTKCKVMVVLKNSIGRILGSDKSDSYFTILP